MTIVVALGCSDGVVIAADSAASDQLSGLKQPTAKINPLKGQAILYGGSGDVGLLQKIHEGLEDYKAQAKLKRLRQELKRLVATELHASSQMHVPWPGGGFDTPPAATCLFVGVLQGQPWILEIERDGRDTIYGEGFGNFAAIGSGGPLAQALFRPHLTTPRDLRLGKIMAYRLIDDAIALSASGLAHPIRIHTINMSGNLGEIKDTEIEGLASTCEAWRALERETVSGLLAASSGKVEIAEIPHPE